MTQLALLSMGSAFVGAAMLSPRAPADSRLSPTGPEGEPLAARAFGLARTAAPGIGAAFAVSIVALVRFSPLVDSMPTLIQRLRDGDGYAAAFVDQSPATIVSPFLAYAEAFGPAGASIATAILAAAAAALMWGTTKRLPVVAAWSLAMIIAPSASTTAALAILALATAIGQLGTRRAAVATGVLAGLASLVAPEAAVAAPFVLFMMFAGSSRWALRTLATVPAVAAIATWWSWLDDEVGIDVLREGFSVPRLFLLVAPISLHWLTDPVDPTRGAVRAKRRSRKPHGLYPAAHAKLGNTPDDL